MIDTISRKLESGVGFSNGCAELALKKPPPLVPSCLMAICEAAGPTAIVCVVIVWPSAVDVRLHQLRLLRRSQRLHDPLRHQHDGEDERERQQHVENGPGQVHPEVAQPVGGAAGEAADEGDHHRYARRPPTRSSAR